MCVDISPCGKRITSFKNGRRIPHSLSVYIFLLEGGEVLYVQEIDDNAAGLCSNYFAKEKHH